MKTQRILTSWQFLVGLGLIVLAVLMGVIVHSGVTQAEDQLVLLEFMEHRSTRATTIMAAVTNAFSPLGTILISVVLAAAAWLWSKNWTRAAYVLGSVAGASLITIILKQLFQRSRPPLLDQLVREVDFGFPSGHTTGIAALAFSVGVVVSMSVTSRLGRVIIWVVAAGFIPLVAGSRLYLGVHWFTDTIAGACVGVGTALALSVMLRSAGRWPRRARADISEPRNVTL
jgi:undecaprenyl-diphosphatase